MEDVALKGDIDPPWYVSRLEASYGHKSKIALGALKSNAKLNFFFKEAEAVEAVLSILRKPKLVEFY